LTNTIRTGRFLIQILKVEGETKKKKKEKWRNGEKGKNEGKNN